MTDPLGECAALMARTGAHPPNECGDPYDCPAHSAQFRAYHGGEADPTTCPQCGAPGCEVESFDEQIGYEEKARPVRVTVLECGHEVVTDRAERAS